MTSEGEQSQRLFLFEREKKLIALLGAIGRPVARTDFQKILFLYCTHIKDTARNGSVTSTYEFVPYKSGAFSFTSYHDRNRLTAKAILKGLSEDWCLTDFGHKLAQSHCTDEIRHFAEQYQTIRGDDLISETYRASPYTATKSEIIARVLKNDEVTLQRVREAIPTAENGGLFTIGYQQRTVENYINLLHQNCIDVLCDVRRNPVSRRYGFGKTALNNACTKMGIKYLHFPQLGVDSRYRKDLHDKKGYRTLLAFYRSNTLPNERKLIEMIHERMCSGERLALTCYERNHEHCHRSILAESLLNIADTWQRGRSSSHRLIDNALAEMHHL